MSKRMDDLKNKIRSKSVNSVHSELIDTSLESKNEGKPKKRNLRNYIEGIHFGLKMD